MFSVRPLQAHDIDPICDLLPGFEGLLQKPNFKFTMCRVGLHGQQLIACALVEPRTLYYGSATLRAAAITTVYVHPKYHGRGYEQTLMHDALTFIAEQGAQVALMHAQPDVEAAFGFSTAFPYYHMSFPAAQAAELPAPMQMRPAHPKDTPALARLYERHWDGRVTFTRNPELWLWRVNRGDMQPFVMVDNDGKVRGYLAGRELLAEDVEVVVDSPAAALTLLHHAGKQAQSIGHNMVHWHIPPDDLLAIIARQQLDVTMSARYPRVGGWSARLLETGTLLSALLPEISAQAQVSPLVRIDPRQVILECHADHVRAGVANHTESIAHIPYRDFNQLLFGTMSAASLGTSGRFNEFSLRLLSALFPPRIALIGCWDWF